MDLILSEVPTISFKLRVTSANMEQSLATYSHMDASCDGSANDDDGSDDALEKRCMRINKNVGMLLAEINFLVRENNISI